MHPKMKTSDVFNSSIPRVADDRRSFIDDQTFSLLMLINPAIITCAISIIGIGANFANIATFAKLGFKETINISLVALAVCDLASLVVLLWMSLSFNPAFCDLVCDVIDLKYYEDSVVGDQRSYFTTVGGCITCLIAFERCMCVLRPLQVKLILSKNRLKKILPTIFIICLIPYSLMFYTTGMVLLSSNGRNTSVLDGDFEDLVIYDIDQISYGLVSALSLSTYVVVTALTALIVWKLTSQSQWRAKQLAADTSRAPATSGNDTNNGRQDSKKGLSEKDRRATMTVTVIAAMYIACFFPGTILYVAMMLSIEFNKGMLYSNLYDFVWYIAYIGEGICASANIIVYMKTSTKFREAFCALFCCFRAKNSHDALTRNITSRTLGT